MIPAVRRRSLVVPREHGAWGILLVPLITGAAVALFTGGSAWPLVPLTIAALALFWLRTPVESWLGTTPVRARTAAEFAYVRTASLALAAAGAVALIWLFWGGRNQLLLWIGVADAGAFSAQALVKQFRRSAKTVAQMIGSAGLTSVAPAAYYVVTGRLDGTAWALWAANFLFAVNQVHFVQLRIRAAHTDQAGEKRSMGRGFLTGQAILAGILVVACVRHWFSWYAALAFLPILYRGFVWFLRRPEPLVIHALGKRELMYACLFGVLLVVGFRLA